jgi:hypothetical protein
VQLCAWPKRHPMLPHAKHVFRPFSSDVLAMAETSGALEIKSRLQVLEEVRERLRQYIPAGSDLAGELIREREVEAEREAAQASGR